jgi:hypothetical protein
MASKTAAFSQAAVNQSIHTAASKRLFATQQSGQVPQNVTDPMNVA